MRNGQGAQLLDGVSGKNPKGEGVKAIVVFRCVGIMKGPENTFIDNSPEADAARAEAARIAREKAEEEAEAKAEQSATDNSFLTDNQLTCFRMGVSDESPVRFQERPKARGVPQRIAPGIFVRANTKNGPLRTVLLCALQLRGNVRHA